MPRGRGSIAFLLVLAGACRSGPARSDATSPDPGSADAAGMDGAPDRATDAGAKVEPRDSGSRDRAGPDGAPATDAGPSLCTGAGMFLCEGFESGAFDPALWKVPVTAGITIESTRAARGKYAMHVHAPNTVGNTYLFLKNTLSLSTNRFGRVFVYIDRDLPERHYFAWQMWQDQRGFTLNIGGSDVFFPLYWIDFGSYPGYILEKEKRPPISRWSCWEWEFDNQANEVRLWADGVRVNLGYPTPDGWTAPHDPVFSIGFGSSHEDPTHPKGFNVWYDEIAIDNQRIGCMR